MGRGSDPETLDFKETSGTVADVMQTAHWESAFADRFISLHERSKKTKVQPTLTGLTLLGCPQLLASTPGPCTVNKNEMLIGTLDVNHR